MHRLARATLSPPPIPETNTMTDTPKSEAPRRSIRRILYGILGAACIVTIVASLWALGRCGLILDPDRIPDSPILAFILNVFSGILTCVAVVLLYMTTIYAWRTLIEIGQALVKLGEGVFDRMKDMYDRAMRR